MNNPAFLVDGFTEKLILEKICPNKKINRIACNGNSVSIQTLAKRVCSLIRLLNNKYYPIIIVIDREERESSSLEIQKALIDEIRNSGINDDIRIGVCDRMIENWILADWTSYLQFCGKEELHKPEDVEGCKGKGLLKKMYPSYQETTDGVNMFLRSSPNIIYINSPSFKSLVDQLTDVECNWLGSLF